MKNLLLMRHAKSSWGDTSLPDHQRPLNGRGKRDAPRMGRHLRDEGIRIDAMLCSTAVRARETLKGLSQEYTFEGKAHYFEELYNADPEAIISILNQLPDEVETAMVIGHNPGLDQYLEIVCDECGHMPTACVAHIEYPLEHWIDLREYSKGKLIHLWNPKEIQRICELRLYPNLARKTATKLAKAMRSNAHMGMTANPPRTEPVTTPGVVEVDVKAEHPVDFVAHAVSKAKVNGIIGF